MISSSGVRRTARKRSVQGGSAAAVVVLMMGLWVPSATAATRLTADRTTGLNPTGQSITVTGHGYKPGRLFYVAECNANVPAGGDCDMAHFKQVQSNASGSWTVTLTVVAQFNSSNCFDTKVKCAIQTSDSGNPRDRTQEATLPLSFAKSAPAPTKAAVKPTTAPTKAPVKPAATAVAAPTKAAPKPVATKPPATSGSTAAGAAGTADDKSKKAALVADASDSSGGSGGSTALFVVAAGLILLVGLMIARRLRADRAVSR